MPDLKAQRDKIQFCSIACHSREERRGIVKPLYIVEWRLTVNKLELALRI